MKSLYYYCLNESDQTLMQHLAIEYGQNDRTLFERLGVFPGCEELAHHIHRRWIIGAEDGKSGDFGFGMKDYTGFKFFDNVRFKYKTTEANDVSAYYVADSQLDKHGNLIKVLNESGNFNEILFEIEIPKKLHTNAFDTALTMHELTHAYQYWNRLKEYDGKRVTDYVRWGSGERNKASFTKNANDTDLMEMTKQFIYMMSSWERGAYIADLKGQLMLHSEELKSPEDALIYVKNTDLYQAYEAMIKLCDDCISHRFTQESIDEIVMTWNSLNYDKVTHKNMKLTPEATIKRMKAAADKMHRKLMRIIPKMCKELYEGAMGTCRTCDRRSFPKYSFEKLNRCGEERARIRKELIYYE